MASIRVAAASLNQTPLDWSGNFARIKKVMAQAKAQNVQVLCLPELCISGYGCEDAFFAPSTTQKSLEILSSLVEETKDLFVTFGLPVFFEGHLYNAVAIVQDGKLLGINAKKKLPREGIHYEYRWFRPWTAGVVSYFEFNEEKIPFGDLYFKCGDVGIGLEICEEAWGAASSSASFVDQCEFILCPSASHFSLGKYKTRETLVANASRALNVFYVYTNLVGLEAGKIIYDGGVMMAQNGHIIARGHRFGFKDSYLTIHDCDPDLVRVTKTRSQAVAVESMHAEKNSAKRVEGKKIRAVSLKELNQPVHRSVMEFEEEFLRAEELALYDYMRKSHAKGYTVSLSGGCDSAVCAILIANMFARASKELGVKLSTSSLVCIYQRTKQSSRSTENIASSLAKELKAIFYTVDVQSHVDSYTDDIEKMTKKKLSWKSDDLTLQNIQARVRAPMAWMLANVTNSILITTSNRSEAVAGYATMDGDMAGGLAPLGGIDKSFLRRWLKWAQTSPEMLAKDLKSIQSILNLAPTAELRPLTSKQEDEKDLMPYDILSHLEKLILRDKLSDQTVLQELSKLFPKYKKPELEKFIAKFWQFFSRSQWKRERMAPSFHLDDLNVDPRSWLRYPIFSGEK